jgi:hypothetical protein
MMTRRTKIFWACVAIAAIPIITGLVGGNSDDSKPRPLSTQEKEIVVGIAAERKRDAEELQKALFPKPTAADRKLFAEELERYFLASGMDASFKVSGRDNTTLTMRYVLVNRPFVYQAISNPTFFTSKRAGYVSIRALGVRHPEPELVRVGSRNAVTSALILSDIALHRDPPAFIPPGQRHSLAELCAAWASSVETWAARRLPETETTNTEEA